MTTTVHVSSFTTGLGCDSTITTTVNVSPVDTSVSLVGVTLTAATGGATYQWIDCDNGSLPIAGATGQSFMPSANGNYAVIVTVNGCSDTSGVQNS